MTFSEEDREWLIENHIDLDGDSLYNERAMDVQRLSAQRNEAQRAACRWRKRWLWTFGALQVLVAALLWKRLLEIL